MALAAVLNFSTPHHRCTFADNRPPVFPGTHCQITGRTPKAASGQKADLPELGYGVGAGKNFVSLEITNQNLGAYGSELRQGLVSGHGHAAGPRNHHKLEELLTLRETSYQRTDSYPSRLGIPVAVTWWVAAD